MHPSVIALIALVALAAYGVWIIKSATSGIPEGFTKTTPDDICKSNLTECKKTKTDAVCVSELAICMSSASEHTNNKTAGQAVYTPSEQRIRSHQTPSTQQPTLTSTTASDAGTQAEQIQSESVLTPSLRQQIRDDVKGAVNSVLADINNQYEIKYVYQ